MGLIGKLIAVLFGSGRNAVVETVEVFRENAEAGALRQAGQREQALAQFAAEFAARQRGGFDRVMDGVNRIPRPALAMGTLGLFIAAMVDPVWFASRMQGIALVPEPLWWLLGVVVSFYFGARHQFKSQSFQSSIATSLAQAPEVMANLEALHQLRAETPAIASTRPDADLTLHSTTPEGNPALEEWRRQAR